MSILRIPSIGENQGASTRTEIMEDTIYSGKALPGSLESEPVWLITRMDITDGGQYPELHPDGKVSFTNAWTDRTTLIYS